MDRLDMPALPEVPLPPSNGSGGGSGDDRTSLECGQQSASPNGSLSNSNSHSSQVKVFVGMVEDFNQHDGSRLLVNVKGRYVAVVYHKGNFYAIDNACYHHGGPLLRGDIEELGGHPCVVCPWHQYKISLKTGEGLYFSIDNIQSSCPTTTLKSKGCKQRVHQVAVEDSKVYLLADFGGEEVESDRYANMALTNPDEENGRVVVHRSPSGSISRRSDDAVVVRSGNGISLHSSISDAHFVGHLRSGEAFRRFSSGRGAGALNPLDSTKRFRSPLSPGSSASTSKFSAGRLNPAKGGEVAAPSTTRAKMSNLSVSCTQMEDVCEGVKEFFFSRVEGTILRQCVLGEYVDLELPIRDPDTGSMMRRRWTICDTNKRGSLFSLMVKARRERAESGSAWLTGMSLHVPLRVIDVAGSFTIIDHFERIRSLQGNALWLTAGIGIVSAYAAVNSTLNDSFFVRNNPSNRERFHMVHVHIDQTYNSIPRVGDFVHHATTFGPRLQKDSQRPPPHSEHIRYAFTAILTRQEKLGLSGSVAPEGMIIPLGRRPTMEELELQVKKAFGAAPFLAFLCGPPQFVQECAAMLIQLGVPSQDILTDAV